MKYRHGRTTYRRDYGSQYTGYGRAGTGTAAEGYLADRRLTGLTSDSEDRDVLNDLLDDACQLVKDDGITVFTVSAVPRGHPKETEIRDRLTACATSASHAFVEDNDADRMQESFQEIGKMVQGIRRVRSTPVAQKSEQEND